jgi:hypothetical protein
VAGASKGVGHQVKMERSGGGPLDSSDRFTSSVTSIPVKINIGQPHRCPKSQPWIQISMKTSATIKNQNLRKNENQKPEKSSDKPKKSVGLLFFIQNLNFE